MWCCSSAAVCLLCNPSTFKSYLLFPCIITMVEVKDIGLCFSEGPRPQHDKYALFRSHWSHWLFFGWGHRSRLGQWVVRTRKPTTAGVEEVAGGWFMNRGEEERWRLQQATALVAVRWCDVLATIWAWSDGEKSYVWTSQQGLLLLL